MSVLKPIVAILATINTKSKEVQFIANVLKRAGGCILALASLRRTESRGAHFRLDHPDADDVRWRVVTRLQLGANNAIEFYTDPIKETVASDVHR